MAKKKEQVALDSDVGSVKIETKAEAYHITFPYKRELIMEMKSVEGASFDKEAKVWTIPAAGRDIAAKAVETLRNKNAELEADHVIAVAAAKAKLDDPKVKDAFTRDETRTTGEILAVTGHYVVQQTAKDKAVIHEKVAMSQEPEVGKVQSVFYKKGLGLVQERKPKAEKEKTAEMAR